MEVIVLAINRKAFTCRFYLGTDGAYCGQRKQKEV
jgi:hypothetical protein